MIVGTKRSIAPYKEDERKVDDGITRPCAYACARMRVAITPTLWHIEILVPDGSSREHMCDYARNEEIEKYREKEGEKYHCVSISVFRKYTLFIIKSALSSKSYILEELY